MRSRKILGLSVGIALGLVTILLVQTGGSVAGRLSETRVLPFTRDLDRVKLSPDGSQLFLLKTSEQINGTDATETHQLEVYDVLSSIILASVVLPTAQAPVAEPWFVMDRLHVCDHGKYLLSYVDNGRFLVLDGRNYQMLSEISFPLPTMPSGEEIVLNSACAANASTAVFELLHAPSPIAAVRVFDLDSGKQVTQVDLELTPGRGMNIDVSPSGTYAAFVKEGRPGDATRDDDLEILDLQNKAMIHPVHTGMHQVQVAFVGDTEIAVASSDTDSSPADTVINLFDVHSGAVVKRLNALPQLARAPIGSSADGRLVMGYTGTESLIGDALQIKNAHFTIWDRKNGKIIAQSPKLHVSKTSTQPLDLNPLSTKNYVRPVILFNQAGNAVVVTGYLAEPVEVYALK
jgi:hypothetical protein